MPSLHILKKNNIIKYKRMYIRVRHFFNIPIQRAFYSPRPGNFKTVFIFFSET